MIKKQLKKIYKGIRRTALEKEMWQIAIRIRTDKPLYLGNAEHFVSIPNSVRYWYADPFLYEKNGKTYLFAEMYDRYTEKGVLGVAKVNGLRVSKFRVCLDLPFHLSYPCLFEDNGNLYMIPECRQSGEVAVYKCVDFPYKWKKDRCLYECTGVDTTMVPADLCGSDKYYITTINTQTDHNNNLFLIDDDKKEVVNLIKDNTMVRCGGYFIKHDDMWLRPAQDDTDYYGCRLIFNDVKHIGVDGIDEKTFLNVYAPHCEKTENGVKVSIDNLERNCRYVGVHTYNANSNYEVIDLVRHNSRTFKVWLCNTIKKMRKK